jgi:uncharacterized protein (DUF2252 family)
MAFDLSDTPATGICLQACGDCHLMNFGGFATPERHLVFDVNDFDETLPAPWEWDLKRLTASIMVAARHRPYRGQRCSDAVLATARAYREALAASAERTVLEVWYARIDASQVLALERRAKAAHPRISIGPHRHVHAGGPALPKVVQVVDGSPRIRDNPPLVYHAAGRGEYERHLRLAMKAYRDSLPDERRALFDRYRLVDVAMKVVGVGSVGTRCAIALFLAEPDDALMLQFKEARHSVLEAHAGKSIYRNQGQRVVVGQRLMQSSSDIFLGWSSTGTPPFDFYVRQLRDMKTSVNLDALHWESFIDYARICGQTLARAHAKTGDAAMISGYLGKADAMDRALERFARAYADQTEADHATLLKAVRAGRWKADLDGSSSPEE